MNFPAHILTQAQKGARRVAHWKRTCGQLDDVGLLEQLEACAPEELAAVVLELAACACAMHRDRDQRREKRGEANVVLGWLRRRLNDVTTARRNFLAEQPEVQAANTFHRLVHAEQGGMGESHFDPNGEFPAPVSALDTSPGSPDQSVAEIGA
ncbi:MAG TPA: hypothetical protein VHC95_06920 [Opitutales bacterium]|nr:hypothetical protein [Opitutales bacterium]